MELKDTSPTKKFDEKEIKCPYCFKIFHHHEVGFRAEPVSQKIIEEYRHKITEVDIDEETAKEYTVKLENAQKYEKQRDDIWLNYWLGKGWAENGALYENEEGYDEHTEPGRDSILTEQQEVVITPGNENSDLLVRYIPDADNFCSAGMDNLGRKMKKRICPHCHNLLPQNYGKYDIKFISVVGISGSGKTVMLSQLLKNIDDYALGVGADVIFDAGANTINEFTKQYPVANNSPLPTGTREHFAPPIFLPFSKVTNGVRKNTTIVIYDIAGESCIRATGLEQYGPFVKNADGIIFLLDPRQIAGFAFADANAEKPAAVLDAMAQAFLLESTSQSKVPIAVAYSKSDKLRETGALVQESHIFKNIDYTGKGFMQSEYHNVKFEVERLMNKYAHSKNLHRRVHTYFTNCGFFAFSSLGHDTEIEKDENGQEKQVLRQNLESIRIEEPLMWILAELGLIDKVNKTAESGKKDAARGPLGFIKRIIK